MPEVVSAFLGTKLWQERANCSVKTGHSPCRSLAQHGLEFAVGQLDGIEVGRILGKVANYRAGFRDGLLDASNFVGAKIVHHDNIVVPQRRNQEPFDIRQKCLAIHGPFNDHWRRHLVMTQSTNEGNRLPLAEWSLSYQSDAPRRSSSDSHHVGAHGRFVDKYQSDGVKKALLSDPAAARSSYVGSTPLLGLQAFF